MRATRRRRILLSIGLSLLVFFIILEAKDKLNYPSFNSVITKSEKALKLLANEHNFLIGAAVAVDPLKSDLDYQSILKREYNIIVPENAMKMENIQPSQGMFFWDDADAIVSFAQKNNMKVRGHTLVWHSQLPGWITTHTWTKDELKTILHDHIVTIVSHYKGEISAWDVVNEALDDAGNLRKNLWFNVIGEEYIALAFEWAHEADPDAKLFYNDYGGEGLSNKSNAIFNLVKSLKERGVPIDGVGLQMHIKINAWPPIEDLRKNLQRLGDIGLETQITEMDVQIYEGSGDETTRLSNQGWLYSEIAKVCLQQQKCTALLTWGFTDKYSWIPFYFKHEDKPLPFDSNYVAKPGYYALNDALKTSTR